MRSPRRVEILLTSRCNLRCRYCSHFSSEADGVAELPVEGWLAFFARLREMAVITLQLSGGEPLLYPDFPRLLAGVVEHRMRFSLNTNGSLVTEALARELAATRRCDVVQISLDSATPEAHDRLRGAGTFDTAVRALERLQAAGVATTVRLTIGKHNVRHLEEAVRFVLDDLGVQTCSTNSAGYLGLCRRHGDEVMLNVEERMLAMRTLGPLKARYGRRLTALAGPQADLDMWGAMARAAVEGVHLLPGRGTLCGCNCVWSSIAVRADGVITPCTQLPHFALGRILQDDLLAIWQSHPELTAFRERHRRSLRESPFCRECAYTEVCTGGCPAVAYQHTGDLYAPDPDSCLRAFLDAGGRLPEADAVPESVWPGRKDLSHVAVG